MISDYYTETLILLSSSTGTTDPFSISTGEDYTTAASISAAVNLLSGNERAQYGEIGFDAQYKCYADVSTEIYEGRRCRWSGDTFVIVDIPKNTLQKDHHIKFLIRELG